MFENLSGGAGAITGAVSTGEMSELKKALEIGYGTDAATFTGGRALQVQSLDKTMQAVIQANDDFTLFNDLSKPKLDATVDEWTEQSGIGGILGGSTNTETGVIPESMGQYDRRVGLVKYLGDRRSVSLVANLTNNIVDAEGVEHANGALKLLSDANYLCYAGDSAVIPTEFDGVPAQLRAAVTGGRVDPQHVKNMKAQPFNSITPIAEGAAFIRGYGNFGRTTHLYMPMMVQSDLDVSLDPAFRVSLSGRGDDITLGAPVSRIRTTQGIIECKQDIFIPQDERMLAPFHLRGPVYAAMASSLVGLQPATVTPGSPGSDAASDFGTPHAGNYYYAVAGINAKGESVPVVSAQVAMAAGQKVAITIASSVGGQELGYAIYRGRKNGTNALADMRLVTRVPRAGATTVWTDLNYRIPGTTFVLGLDMRRENTAILWRQLLPMFKFKLFPTDSAVLPWAQLLFGYLRISKLRHHIIYDNVLPTGATWRPFG
jgi:hypothetical protein